MTSRSNIRIGSPLKRFVVMVALGSVAMLTIGLAWASGSVSEPGVKNKRWPRQRLDYFILARLEEKQLSPSIEPGKRTLIRRATFDLTGLPPTPEEVEAYLKDDRDKAYERLVERLLFSSRFGERMASLWLPLARYAEDQPSQA